MNEQGTNEQGLDEQGMGNQGMDEQGMNQQGTSNETIDAIEFYWRPGCPFCAMLERDLNQANIPLDKRNIWDDPQAAQFVRSVADGNETVPTISIAGRSMVNPAASEVSKLLGEVAPHLVSN